MTPTRHNALTKTIKQLEAMERAQPRSFRPVTRAVRDMLLSAEVFFAPLNGRYTDLEHPWVDAQSFFDEDPDSLRLPFPVTAIEFESEIDGTGDFHPSAHLSVAIEAPTAISFGLLKPEDNARFAILCGFVVPSSLRSIYGEAKPITHIHWIGMQSTSEAIGLRYGSRMLFPLNVAPSYRGDVQSDVESMWREDEVELQAAADFLLAYGATNFSVASPAANVTRASKSTISRRHPWFRYHTLVLNDQEAALTDDEGSSGTHASPAMHRRRGHFRRLGGGRRVFVRSCIVGSPRSGLIVKDYDAKELAK